MTVVAETPRRVVPARARRLRAVQPQAGRVVAVRTRAHGAAGVEPGQALERRVAWLKSAGADGSWAEPEAGKGPAFEFRDPDGHPCRIYYETEKYVAPADSRPAMKSNHQRYLGRGANVRRLEHVNLMAADVRGCREFWETGFGLRTYEIIRRARWRRGRGVAEQHDPGPRGHLRAGLPRAGGDGCTTWRSGWTRGRRCCARRTSCPTRAWSSRPGRPGTSRSRGSTCTPASRAGTGSRSAAAGTCGSTRTTTPWSGRPRSTPPSPAGARGSRKPSAPTAPRRPPDRMHHTPLATSYMTTANAHASESAGRE